jgi:two-component system, NtrC family, sensor kinase
MRDAPKNPYTRLRRQMLSVLLSFGLVPLVLMGVAGFIANREAIEARMRNVLEAMVKNRLVTIELFLEEKMRQLEFAALTHPVSQLSNPEHLESLREQMQRNHGAIIDLGLFDDRGQHIAYAGPYKLQNLNYSHESWFERVMVLGRYESDIFLGMRHLPHMVMAVKKREEGKDWILRATIDTDILSALVREGGLESGADVFILNRAGEYQTSYSDEHRLMEKADIGPLPLHSGVRAFETNRNGKREYVATAWLRGDSWVLIARQQAPGLFALLPGHPVVMWLLAAGLVAIPILSYFIARHRLSQFRMLEGERAALYESVAQSQKMAAIGRLAAGIAHEINNPLAIIQAQVGVLSDMIGEDVDFPHAAEFKDRAAKIQAQVERGRKVTHRLLGFSRRVGPELEPVDVIAALEETIGFVEKDLESSHIHVVRTYDRDMPIIRSSLAQMQQVFLNLINNALDVIGEGGELRLSAERSDGGVAVKVADTGPGIPEKDLQRIFEPFFSTKSTDGRHNGLGLAICQEIMRNLKGRIGVDSTVGMGTVFLLWFPLDVQE